MAAARAGEAIWGVTLLNDWSIRNDMGQRRVLSFNLALVGVLADELAPLTLMRSEEVTARTRSDGRPRWTPSASSSTPRR